jgi:hypothetical protein
VEEEIRPRRPQPPPRTVEEILEAKTGGRVEVLSRAERELMRAHWRATKIAAHGGINPDSGWNSAEKLKKCPNCHKMHVEGSQTWRECLDLAGVSTVITPPMPKKKKPEAPKPKETAAAPKPTVNKSGWIRDQDSHLSAKELVELAAAEGIKITDAQVYTARSDAKKRAKLEAAEAAGARPAAAGPKAAKASGDAEAELRRQMMSLIFEYGRRAVRSMLEELESSRD